MAFDILKWLNREFTPGTGVHPWSNPYWQNWYSKWYVPPAYSTIGSETPTQASTQAAGTSALAQLALPFLTPVDVNQILTSLKQNVPVEQQSEEMKEMFQHAGNWVGWANTQQRTTKYESAFTQASRLQKFTQLLNAVEGQDTQSDPTAAAWMSLPESVRSWVRNVLNSAISYYSRRRTYGEQLEFLSNLETMLNTEFPQPTGDSGTANVNTIPQAYVRQIAETLRRLVLPTMLGAGWGMTGWTPIGGAPRQGYGGRGSWY